MRVRAPELKLSEERNSDPEAGMPPAMAEATFATPTANTSWFTSARSPEREAMVFAISVFSRQARKAMASATPSKAAMSSKIPLRVRSGKLGGACRG